MSIHWHVVTSGFKGAERYTSAQDAEDAVCAQAEARLAEEEARGLPGTIRRIRDGWLVRYGDEYLHGEPSFTVTACTDSHEADSAPVTVRVEVWPLSAHENGPAGIWLLSGVGPWTAGPVRAEEDPHEAVERLLGQNHALEPSFLLHSTSWRAEGTEVILTYVAALSCPHALSHWPDCQPVDRDLPRLVGIPPTHAATDVPVNRYIDVLHHGIRHLAFLENWDQTARAAMPPVWRRELQAWAPALAGLYSRRHVPEVLSEIA